jgi:hypothetical protein
MVAYSFRPRFVDAIKLGLGKYAFEGSQSIFGPKRQTIRAIGKRRHARSGELLQLYTGMRTRQCKLIGYARCTEVLIIVIAFGKTPNSTIISIDEHARYMGTGLTTFARLDGFSDWDDMLSFWEKEHGTEQPFRGVLIKWEQLNNLPTEVI